MDTLEPLLVKFDVCKYCKVNKNELTATTPPAL